MNVLDPEFGHRLGTALAAGRDPLLSLLNDLFSSLRGVRTVTWLATAPDLSVTHRIGTSDPVSFPVGGSDPIDDGAWNRRIFGEKRPVVGNSPKEMAKFIPETPQLVAMGYGATLCMPIVVAGEVRGTLNLLGEAGILDEDLLAQVTTLLPIAALVFTLKGISAR